MGQLSLYAVFHLNLMYSAIERHQRPVVIRDCYWPLLHLISDKRMPLAVEASGLTLELIEDIDPLWIKRLRELCHDGVCEFIGSGYAQLIGPLVPARVNQMNQNLGIVLYRRLLELSPTIALINEQAYAPGLIDHYLQAGYQAVIMEWNNPARFHPEWSHAWRYAPQWIKGTNESKMPVIWNDAIAFQQFQRFAQAEIDIGPYLTYLRRHVGNEERCFPLYGGDCEVFDYRPGRYEHEAGIAIDGEWHRIGLLLEALAEESKFQMIFPSDALDMSDSPTSGNILTLESPQQPIPVKKQEKYNIVRWAVTGIDDLGANTLCWRYYKYLCANNDIGHSYESWKQLCRLWSSDYRTHITRARWQAYRDEMLVLSSELQKEAAAMFSTRILKDFSNKPSDKNDPSCRISQDQDRRYLVIETESLQIRLNLRRGLAIDHVVATAIFEGPLLGTLPHSYYDDIGLGNDYYSGHLIFEAPGKPKVTDLNPCTFEIKIFEHFVAVHASIPTPLGPIQKTVNIYKTSPMIDIRYQFPTEMFIPGSLRLGHITLMPEAFDMDALSFQTHNGGFDLEHHALKNHSVNHGATFSFLISATQALGLTEGRLLLGDERRKVEIKVDQTAAAMIAMITYLKSGDAHFCRASLSAREMDDTARPPDDQQRLPWPQSYSLTLLFHNTV